MQCNMTINMAIITNIPLEDDWPHSKTIPEE